MKTIISAALCSVCYWEKLSFHQQEQSFFQQGLETGGIHTDTSYRHFPIKISSQWSQNALTKLRQICC